MAIPWTLASYPSSISDEKKVIYSRVYSCMFPVTGPRRTLALWAPPRAFAELIVSSQKTAVLPEVGRSREKFGGRPPTTSCTGRRALSLKPLVCRGEYVVGCSSRWLDCRPTSSFF